MNPESANRRILMVKIIFKSETIQAIRFENPDLWFRQGPGHLTLVVLQAVVSASRRELAAAVEAIRAENSVLAEEIQQCLYNFEYDKILNLIPQEDS